MNKATTALVVAGTLIGAGAASQANAQSLGVPGLKAKLGAGFTYEPEYMGADEREWDYLPIIDVSYGPVFFNLDQGLGYSFVKTSNLQAGATINYVMGREAEGDDGISTLRGFKDIDNSVELGMFVEFAFDFMKFDAAYNIDVGDGHEGQKLDFGVSFGAAVSQNMTVIGRLGATWGDEEYNDAYFGVHSGTIANGYSLNWLDGQNPGNINSEYHAEAGLHKMDFTLTAEYQFNQNWGMMARGGATYLIEQGGKSPIVKDIGDDIGMHAGMALTYTF